MRRCVVPLQRGIDLCCKGARWGGISRFVGELLVRFLFNDAAIHVLAAGALLQFNNPLNPGVQVSVLMFLKWAFFVADCKALQQLLLWRGASATQM